MKKVVSAARVTEFKGAFDGLNTNGFFVDIFKIRRSLNWSREEFDGMLRALRDAEIIQLHVGDKTTITVDEFNDNFVDENGFALGSVTWNDGAVIHEVEIEVSGESTKTEQPTIEEFKVVDDFDYSKLTVKELKELAKYRKVRGYSKMRKAELVAIFKGEVEAPKSETKFTVRILREVAKDRGIKGYSRMRKAELMAALAA